MRRIAAAAILHEGKIHSLPPPNRHYHVMLAGGIWTNPETGLVTARLARGKQGFIDEHGVFLDREEAYLVAAAAGQLIAREGGYKQGEISDGPTLFSEDLW